MTEGATPGARRIARAFAEAVARQGRSTEQLAEAIGLPRTAFEARLRGDAPFGLDEIERLAAELALGVTTLVSTTDPHEEAAGSPRDA